MNWPQYWPYLEITLIIAVFALVIMRMWQTSRRRAQTSVEHPSTLSGKIRFGTIYVLRLAGFAMGTFLLVALVVMIERNIFTLITETAPAPSEVTVLPNLGFEVEELTFESEDGLTIAGWFAPSQNSATVILLHGYGGNRTGTIWYAQELTKAGYGVLMYDERASGESEGTHRSYGWEDPRDVGGAINYLSSRSDAGEQVGILGCSIGAQIALQGAASYPQIMAVWADGPSSVRAQDMPAPKNPSIALVIAAIIPWIGYIKSGSVSNLHR
jgi:dipeptidyl aminopeptidase/acylaminoacyl peptidase